MDYAGFLLVLATAMVLRTTFGPVLDWAVQQWAYLRTIGEEALGRLLAEIAQRLLMCYLGIYMLSAAFASSAIADLGKYLPSDSHAVTVWTVVVVLSLIWLTYALVRLLMVKWVPLRILFSMGTPGGVPADHVLARCGEVPETPLMDAVTPIFWTSVFYAVVSVWFKWRVVAGGAPSPDLLYLRMGSSTVLQSGLLFGLGAPILIGYYVAKAIDPFMDVIGLSILRAIAIAAPGITAQSFDRLSVGGRLNIPLEQVFPALISIVAPQIAIAITIHEMAMWNLDGFNTAYMNAVISAGTMAGFCLWAFGMKTGEWPQRVIYTLWAIIISSVIFHWLQDAGVIGHVQPYVPQAKNIIAFAWERLTAMHALSGIALGLMALILSLALWESAKSDKNPFIERVVKGVMAIPPAFALAGIGWGMVEALVNFQGFHIHIT